MPRLAALLLVVAVHLAVALTAWQQVGFLADDTHMVGGAVLRHTGTWSFASMFVRDVPVGGAAPAVALYRPFLDLVFWLEQPWFGFDPLGYHVVNSAMHCATALLWLLLVQRLTRSLSAGLAAALLFVGFPGHSEALHWIAARTNVQSTLLLSAALVTLDGALTGRGRLVCAAGRATAAVFAVLAIGTKESAVFVLPLAALLSWLRTRRLASALLAWAPMAIAAAAWLAWRAHCLGTWGSGTHYGWHLERVTVRSCLDWLGALLAPRHRDYTPFAWLPVLLVAHLALLFGALRAAWRAPTVRGLCGLAAVLLVCGYVACIGLEPLDPATLENIRYGYEPTLALCALGGIAIAALPGEWRGLVIAGFVVVHATVLDHNRQSWLRASAVYKRLSADVVGVARASQRPLRVIDAPGVYEGAFAWLNGFTEFRFLQAVAPAGTDLRGGVASTQEWDAVLRELAGAAQRGEALVDWFTVRWNDGSLVPLELDRRWPAAAWSGARVGYARIARTNPFAGDELPVHVLLETRGPVTLQAVATDGEGTWRGAMVAAAGTPDPIAVALRAPIPDDVPEGREVAVELHLANGDGQQRVFGLGRVVVTAR